MSQQLSALVHQYWVFFDQGQYRQSFALAQQAQRQFGAAAWSAALTSQHVPCTVFEGV